MKFLDREKEIQILKILNDYDLNDLYIGNGSSRVVVDCPKEVYDLLDSWGVYADPSAEYIIKIGIGIAGFNQTEKEVEIYEQYNECVSLAYIPCAGNMIEIMEKVTVLPNLRDFYSDKDFFLDINDAYRKSGDYEDYSDDLEELQHQLEAEGRDIQYHYSIVNDLDSIASFLDDVFEAYTVDNGQLGVSVNGDAVAYDFGFVPYSEDKTYMSEESDYIESFLNEYVEKLLSFLLSRAEQFYYSDEVEEFNTFIAQEF